MSVPEESFESLMARVRTGCPDAARELFDRYSDPIRRIVRRKLHQRLRPRYDSVDFTQEVWASFFAAPWERYTFDTPEALVGFLAEVAYGKVAKAFRRGFQTRKYDLNRERSLDRTAGDDGPDRQAADRGPTPSQVAIANEQWARMNAGQPDRFRLMLQLLREGHNIKEVAERTGLHPKAIQRWLYKKAQAEGLS